VGLFGPMEQRHLPRSIETIKKGYVKVAFYYPNRKIFLIKQKSQMPFNGPRWFSTKFEAIDFILEN